MENHINLDNNANNIIYNKIYNKIEIPANLSNKELINKYLENVNILKNIYKQLFNNNSNVTLMYNEDKIYELFFINLISNYRKLYKIKPNIIISIENNNLLNMLKKLEINNLISLTIIKPNINNQIILKDIVKYIKKNTCFISLSYSNEIYGTIHDIENITNLCNQKNIFLHINISEIFLEITLNTNNIDLITLSYKKYNIKGLTIIYSNKLIEYFKCNNIIEELNKIERRYTVNNIKSILFIIMLINIKMKNLKFMTIRNYNLKEVFINKLKEYINVVSYNDYLNNNIVTDFSIICFDYRSNQPNLLVLSIHSKTSKFISKKFITNLNQYGIYISYLNNNLPNGIIYLKFHENIKVTDITLLIKAFLKCIQIQYPELLNNHAKSKTVIKSINKIKKRVRFTTPEFVILSKKKDLPQNNQIIKGILIVK
jgi:hypothetical protein